MRTRRTSLTAATILVVAAVTAASAAWAIASPSPTERELEALADARQDAVAAGPAEPRGQQAGDRGSRVPISSTDAAARGQQSAPGRLRIPSLGVDAPVVATGVTRAGNAEIPADGDVIGWYQYGSAPGDDQGNAVLIGHRDTNAEGPGALFDLDLLTEGSTISIVTGRQTRDYRVVSVRSVEKSGLPSSLFRRSGSPQLVVITCGGPFLPEAGGYQENLFAVAVPRKG